MKQTEISFPTNAPINIERLSGQNKTVFEWLASGKTINCLQGQEMFITAVNSRISDLRNKFGIKIYDRFVSVGKSKIKEYSLKQFEC